MFLKHCVVVVSANIFYDLHAVNTKTMHKNAKRYVIYAVFPFHNEFM